MEVKLERLRQNCFSFPQLNLSPLFFFFFVFLCPLRAQLVICLDLVCSCGGTQTRRMPHFFITESLAAKVFSSRNETLRTKSQPLSVSGGYFSLLFCISEIDIREVSAVGCSAPPYPLAVFRMSISRTLHSSISF